MESFKKQVAKEQAISSTKTAEMAPIPLLEKPFELDGNSGSFAALNENSGSFAAANDNLIPFTSLNQSKPEAFTLPPKQPVTKSFVEFNQPKLEPIPKSSQVPPARPPNPFSGLSFEEVWDHGIEALLGKDYPRAQLAFLEAKKIQPNDPKVQGNLQRLEVLLNK